MVQIPKKEKFSIEFFEVIISNNFPQISQSLNIFKVLSQDFFFFSFSSLAILDQSNIFRTPKSRGGKAGVRLDRSGLPSLSVSRPQASPAAPLLANLREEGDPSSPSLKSILI